MKIVIWTLAIVGVALAVGTVAAVKLRGMSGHVEGTEVRAETVSCGDVVEIVSAPGQVQPKVKVSISARVAARIAELPFDEGATVTKGNLSANPPVPPSLLVRLDAKDLEALVTGAQAHFEGQLASIKVADARIAAEDAGIKAQQVMLADARRDLRQQKELLVAKVVAQSVVDEAQAKVEQLEHQLVAAQAGMEADRLNLIVMRHESDAAKSQIDQAKESISYTVIESPIDGVVTRLNAKVGELVMTGTMNNAGTVILEVADLSRMIVNCRVDESVIGGVQTGQKAVVRIQAYPDEVFEGTVQAIALDNTEDRDGSKYYKTEVLLDTKGRRIYSGLTAEAEIQTKRHCDALKVPSQAVLGRPVDNLPAELRDRPEVEKSKAFATVVYRLVNGKAVATPVKVGPSDMTHTVIKSGLAAGDRVITGPFKVLEGLAHDQAVKEEGAATQPGTQPATQPSTRPADNAATRPAERTARAR